MLKQGDFVTVKDGIELEDGGKTTNWAGQITAVYKEYDTYLIHLDAVTLTSLSDDYLKDSLENGGETFQYVFEKDDLILGERRDTDELLDNALDDIDERISVLEQEEFANDNDPWDELDELDEMDTEKYDLWINGFIGSSYYGTLSEYQQEKSSFVVSSFLENMYNYEYVTEPEDWSTENIRSICLDISPRKITAEDEFFESYGDVLLQFLKYFETTTYIESTQELQAYLIQIKDQIIIQAKDSSNWGMAKSMMMAAQAAGVDPTDENQLSNFLFQHNMNLVKDLERAPMPMVENPYREIGRNDKVSVKYEDGRVVENVKFKKVQKDLLDGNCELM